MSLCGAFFITPVTNRKSKGLNLGRKAIFAGLIRLTIRVYP